MPVVSFLAAYTAGVLTFFATCLLPVLPVYIGYLGGLSVDVRVGVSEQKKAFYRRTVFTHSLAFVGGFLLVFTSLGIAATALGRLIATYRSFFQKAGAVLLFILGISMLDFVRIPFVSRTFKFDAIIRNKPVSHAGAFIFGMTFGFAWTPCIGPVLATILFLVSQVHEVWYGASLLAVFALGLGTPFLVVGVLFESIRPKLSSLGRWSFYLQKIFGLIIIAVALLLLTGHLSYLSAWSLKFGGSLVL